MTIYFWLYAGAFALAFALWVWWGIRIARDEKKLKHDGPTVPLEEIRQRLRDETLERERERIQKQEACSEKSHWRSG